MPSEDIDVSAEGIADDQRDPDAPEVEVEKDAPEIDVSNEGITPDLDEHHPGVEKSEGDGKTAQDRLAEKRQKKRREALESWSEGAGTADRGSVELADAEDVVRASHNPEEFEKEQQRKKIVEELAEELDGRDDRDAEDRERVSKSGSGAVEKCAEARTALDDVAESLRGIKDTRDQIREYLEQNPDASDREVVRAVSAEV